jgi:phage terminase small subunit
MPPLPNGKQEKFCVGVALDGLSFSKAYEAAGYRPHRHNAAALARQQHISDRIAELQADRNTAYSTGIAQAVQAKQVTVETILDALERALAGAENEKDWKAMVSAAIGQARVAGLMVEKHLVKAQHEFNAEEMDDDEIHEFLVQVQLQHCAALGLDPDVCTITQYLAAQEEEHAARKARELNPAPPQRAVAPRPALPRPRPAASSNGASQNATAYDLRRTR